MLATRHAERIRTALAGQQSGIVLVDDLDQGLDVVNAYAAEHLEIQTARRRRRGAARVRNAGAIFVGPFAPVSLGDYCAGSNHVLPTGGCACHSSGLSVRAFLQGRCTSSTTRATRCAEVADHVVTLAEAEDLPGHGAAVRVRFERREPADDLPAPARGAARHRAVRRAAARRARPAQRQREPLPALARPCVADIAARGGRGRRRR